MFWASQTLQKKMSEHFSYPINMLIPIWFCCVGIPTNLLFSICNVNRFPSGPLKKKKIDEVCVFFKNLANFRKPPTQLPRNLRYQAFQFINWSILFHFEILTLKVWVGKQLFRAAQYGFAVDELFTWVQFIHSFPSAILLLLTQSDTLFN